MRCQVHLELAMIEEVEGRLEASLTHLQKAMLLDNGRQQERLSSALRLLQLRETIYQTPSRAEDKAALLMQQVLIPLCNYKFTTQQDKFKATPFSLPQVKDIQSQDKTNARPILVSVGLLLGPDDFQTVLDGDNPSTDFLVVIVTFLKDTI